jgi:hypothetical protein
MSDPHIAWHPAFAQVIQLELAGYRDSLEFRPEEQVSEEPLRADVFIIKKKPELKIEKGIGHLFNQWNVIEYKSPQDYFSVKDYYKVKAYTYLLAAGVGKNHQGIKIGGLTMSLVLSHKPSDLFAELEKNYKIKEYDAGIYYIKGDDFPVQIIVRPELSDDDSVFIKNFGPGLKPKDIIKALEGAHKYQKSIEIKAFIDVILTANTEAAKEAFKMDEILDEIMEETGLAQKWHEEGRQKGREELVTNALSKGKTITDISDFTGLDTKTVQEIASKWESASKAMPAGK